MTSHGFSSSERAPSADVEMDPDFSGTAPGERLVTRHADVRAVLADARFEVREATASNAVGTVGWLRASVSRFTNGEVHQLRRRQVIEELRPLKPDALRSAAYQRARLVLAAAGESGQRIELMSLLGRRVPMATLAEVLGITNPERAAEAAIAAASAYLNPDVDAESQRRADAGVADLVEMIRPAEMSAVVTKIALMVQGCDATAGLIGLALLRLRDAPEPADIWTTDALVVETVRHSPPLRVIRRVAAASMDRQRRAVAGGDVVLCSVEDANRDPSVFDHPDEFDPTRRERPSLTFGYGIRPCPAAPHALMLAGGVVDAVRESCDSLSPGEVEYEETQGLRIPLHLYMVAR